MTEFVHQFAAFSLLTKFLLIVALIGTLSSTVYLVIVLVAARRYLRLTKDWVDHVLLPRGWRETVGDELRWMKSTRYSRPAGHVGSGLTYAVPFGLVGWMVALAGGLPVLGWTLLGVAFANRVIQSIAVGWGVGRDSRALKSCWLYPLRDLQGFLTWLISFISRDFSWRGETYRFGKGGRITPKLRPATFVSAAPPPN